MHQHPDDIVAAMKVRIRPLKQGAAESLEPAARGAIPYGSDGLSSKA